MDISLKGDESTASQFIMNKYHGSKVRRTLLMSRTCQSFITTPVIGKHGIYTVPSEVIQT
jgi:hypothetical protein